MSANVKDFGTKLPVILVACDVLVIDAATATRALEPAVIGIDLGHELPNTGSLPGNGAVEWFTTYG